MVQLGPNSTNGGIWLWRGSSTNPAQPGNDVHAGSYVRVINYNAALVIPNDAAFAHVMLGRKAGAWYLFVDGQPSPNNGAVNTTSITQTALYLGRNNSTTEEFVGRMQEFRAMVGACRWVEPFTPPAAPSDFPVVP